MHLIKKIILAIFDNVNVGKLFCQRDGYIFLKDAVLTSFPENEYLDQFRDLKIFYKEYVGEELLFPFISYTEMKNKYPIQIIDLRHQVDLITSKKFRLPEEFITDPAKLNARLFVILNRH